jgi:hypothetical protein
MWLPPSGLIGAAVSGAQVNATLRANADLVSGRTTKVVSCENCHRRYAYELDRVGHGAEHLERLLAEGVEAIPCPACGWYQSGMLPEVRKRHCRWMLYLGQCLTIGLVPVVVAGLILNGYPRFQTAPMIPWPLFAAGLVCVLAAGIGMFVWRRRRVRDFNPNDGDAEARKRDGRARAVLVPETSPDGITADVGPGWGLSRGPNITAVAGHAESATPAGESGRLAGGDQDPVALKVLLGCIGCVVLIIGGVSYWKDSKRKEEDEFKRYKRSIEQAQQRGWEQRMREGLKVPGDQPQLWDIKPPRR